MHTELVSAAVDFISDDYDLRFPYRPNSLTVSIIPWGLLAALALLRVYLTSPPN